MTGGYDSLLRLHDDPVFWEQPPGFDRAAAILRFKRIHRALEKASGLTLKAQTGSDIQDASFHSQIRLDQFNNEIIVIRFSNFGDMVAICGEEGLPAGLLSLVKATLEGHGYIFVPEEALGTYTGKNPGVTGIDSWWIRYFDWV